MSVHNPAASSFSRYAQENLGPLAGYITGWTYCFEILIVAIADVTAFGIYMGVWFPTVLDLGTERGADHLRRKPDEREGLR